MDVLVFNGSPKMQRSNTSLILAPFIEGMEMAGAEVETIIVRKLQISPCQGDLACWVKTPGCCFQNDDMQMLYPKLQQADIWVLATPVYLDGLPGQLKNLIDRMIPLISPFFELRDGHFRHALRPEHKPGKVVLVANCGYWEMDNFDPLLVHMKAMCKNMGKEFTGALLRPHGEAMRFLMRQGEPLDDIFEAMKEAGRELVCNGSMSTETMNVAARALLPSEAYMELLNNNFVRVINKNNQRRQTKP